MVGPLRHVRPARLIAGVVALEGRRRAPAFALRDQDSRVVSAATERGRPVLLAFMDPLCKQECPTEGRTLALAEREVPPAQRAVLLIASVNPTPPLPTRGRRRASGRCRLAHTGCSEAGRSSPASGVRTGSR